MYLAASDVFSAIGLIDSIRISFTAAATAARIVSVPIVRLQKLLGLPDHDDAVHEARTGELFYRGRGEGGGELDTLDRPCLSRYS